MGFLHPQMKQAGFLWGAGGGCFVLFCLFKIRPFFLLSFRETTNQAGAKVACTCYPNIPKAYAAQGTAGARLAENTKLYSNKYLQQKETLVTDSSATYSLFAHHES